MTHSAHTPASAISEPDSPEHEGRTLPSDGLTGRARRARAEPMTVRALRDDRYVVETDGGTYVVDLGGPSCTCPDHAIRGNRCKHLRRVAIEVSAGRVAPPGHRRSACAVCGERLFVPVGQAGPATCDAHTHAPGDVVADRESGGETDGASPNRDRLVVVAVLDARADGTETAAGRLVSDYETNRAYGGQEPVVEAVYLGDIAREADLTDCRRYRFPTGRLVPTGRRYGPMADGRDRVGETGATERTARA